MFMLGNFLLALADLVGFALTAYFYIVIGRVIISWVNADPYNPVVKFLVQATEPVLEKIRRYIPPMGGLDLSPLLLILALRFSQFYIVQTLIGIGQRLQ
jgi:YggT family protein